MVEKEAARRKNVRHGKFMAIFVACKIKMRTKKMGGSLKDIHSKYIRNKLTLMGLVSLNKHEKMAANIIFPVLEKLV